MDWLKNTASRLAHFFQYAQVMWLQYDQGKSAYSWYSPYVLWEDDIQPRSDDLCLPEVDKKWRILSPCPPPSHSHHARSDQLGSDARFWLVSGLGVQFLLVNAPWSISLGPGVYVASKPLSESTTFIQNNVKMLLQIQQFLYMLFLVLLSPIAPFTIFTIHLHHSGRM
jgi:hypothetical protein